GAAADGAPGRGGGRGPDPAAGCRRRRGAAGPAVGGPVPGERPAGRGPGDGPAEREPGSNRPRRGRPRLVRGPDPARGRGLRAGAVGGTGRPGGDGGGGSPGPADGGAARAGPPGRP